MSIESDLHDIATSLAAIANHIISVKYEQRESAPVPPVPAAMPPVPPPAAAPVPAPAPAPFPAPAPAAAPAALLPFHDQQSLMTYVMAKYGELGPAKGGLIQGVLGELGISHVSALPPEQFAAFYLKVEAL